ncbi:MAG: type II toxin-antitoxin system VapC family toxin [Acidobacteria bacterium]|nr:type II toxin-antitoxin system VapC family toxin [Acidobacteriota bacterium]
MVADTSALIAVLQNEEDAARFAGAIAEADTVLVSAASVAEAGIVMLNRHGPPGADKVRALIREAGLRVEDVTAEHAEIAVEAYEAYDKGGQAPGKANLNYGDCFSYALAKTTGLPLLFKGHDFSHTDIARVL